MTQGDIQTLEQYSHMLCDDSLMNHFGSFTTPQKDALFPLKVSNEEILLLPALVKRSMIMAFSMFFISVKTFSKVFSVSLTVFSSITS